MMVSFPICTKNLEWYLTFISRELETLFCSCIRDHSSITSAKRWVGVVRKWQSLLIYNTIYADVGRWVGLKKPKTCWRNTWMVPKLVKSKKHRLVHQKSLVVRLILHFIVMMVWFELIKWLLEIIASYWKKCFWNNIQWSLAWLTLKR